MIVEGVSRVIEQVAECKRKEIRTTATIFKDDEEEYYQGMLKHDIQILIRLLAPKSLSDFWKSLPDAAMLKEYSDEGNSTAGDKFLCLYPGYYFLGDDRLGSKLLVRKCYEEFAEIAMDVAQRGGTLAISGSSGIGKSYFLLYLLHYLCLKEPESTIVLHAESIGKWYLFSNQRILVAKNSLVIRKYLNMPNTWYLVDRVHYTYSEVAAKTIAVLPPVLTPQTGGITEQAMMVMMPSWSKYDIDVLRRV